MGDRLVHQIQAGVAHQHAADRDALLLSPRQLSRRAVDQMSIFVASELGVNPAAEMAHYSAEKTMEISVSRNLAELTKGTNVTVNAVLPGPVNTEGVGTFIANVFPELPTSLPSWRAAERPPSTAPR